MMMIEAFTRAPNTPAALLVFLNVHAEFVASVTAVLYAAGFGR